MDPQGVSVEASGGPSTEVPKTPTSPTTPRRSDRATKNPNPNYGGGRSRQNSFSERDKNRSSKSATPSTSSTTAPPEDSTPDPIDSRSRRSSEAAEKGKAVLGLSSGGESSAPVLASNESNSQGKVPARLEIIPEVVESPAASTKTSTRDSTPDLVMVPSTPASMSSQLTSQINHGTGSNDANRTPRAKAAASQPPARTTNQAKGQETNPAPSVIDPCSFCNKEAGEDCWGLIPCQDKIHKKCLDQLPKGIKKCPDCGVPCASAVHLIGGNIIDVEKYQFATPSIDMPDRSERSASVANDSGSDDEVGVRRDFHGDPLPPQLRRRKFPRSVLVEGVPCIPQGFVKAPKGYWLMIKVLPEEKDGIPFYRLLRSSGSLNYTNEFRRKIIPRGKLTRQDKWDDLTILGVLSPSGAYEKEDGWTPTLYIYVTWGKNEEEIYTKSDLVTRFGRDRVEEFIEDYLEAVKKHVYPVDIFGGSSLAPDTDVKSQPANLSTPRSTRDSSRQPGKQVSVERGDSAGDRNPQSPVERDIIRELQNTIRSIQERQARRNDKQQNDDVPRGVQQPTPDLEEL